VPRANLTRVQPERTSAIRNCRVVAGKPSIAERYRKRAAELRSNAQKLTELADRYSRLADEVERGAAPPIAPELESPTSGDKVLDLLIDDDAS
jgi:hypothetical protein